MIEFIESNDLLDRPIELRHRLDEDGYLFIRGILPRSDVLSLRKEILHICRDAGWLEQGSELMDGISDHEAIQEGSEAWRQPYARIQELESFHRLKLHPSLLDLMECLHNEPSFALPMTIARVAFPNDNANGTSPHQDHFYVGGSPEIITCWVPLGDTPRSVGGLRVQVGSHKADYLPVHQAPGPGGHAVDVDPKLEWAQSDYRAGDILLFHSYTIHDAAPNNTPNVLRLSADYRYAGVSHTVQSSWMSPHFHWLGDHFGWDALDKQWRHRPTARYWEHIPNLKTT